MNIFKNNHSASECNNPSFFVISTSLKILLNMYIGRVRNALQAIFYPTNLINGGASFRWSFGLLFAWGSIESTTILTTHPSLRQIPGKWVIYLSHAWWSLRTDVKNKSFWIKNAVGKAVIFRAGNAKKEFSAFPPLVVWYDSKMWFLNIKM